MPHLRRFSLPTTALFRRSQPRLRGKWIRTLSAQGVFQENEVVLLRRKERPGTHYAPVLTKPLVCGDKLALPDKRDCFIYADDIIGKSPRSLVRTTNGKIEFRLHEPSVGEYTTLSARIVTPIYPQDANLVVSLLELNPSPPSLLNIARSTLPEETFKKLVELIPASEPSEEDRLEIFEAGTGHGALTLHLARAIHCANAPAPKIPSQKQRKSSPKGAEMGQGSGVPLDGMSASSAETSLDNSPDDLARQEQETTYKKYLVNRRAMIQTLDNSPLHSAHAQKIVRNFRNGIYYPNINFHVGTIQEYLSSRLDESSGTPFLSHTILDLPDTHDYLTIVAQATKVNGSLVTWNPSISQVMRCVDVVRGQRMPWLLERVLEVGLSAGVGGKEWDVRAVMPRAREKALAEAKQEAQDGKENYNTDSEDNAPVDNSGWEMICRPKVGMKIEGGGFVALWRKMEMR